MIYFLWFSKIPLWILSPPVNLEKKWVARILFFKNRNIFQKLLICLEILFLILFLKKTSIPNCHITFCQIFLILTYLLVNSLLIIRIICFLLFLLFTCCQVAEGYAFFISLLFDFQFATIWHKPELVAGFPLKGRTWPKFIFINENWECAPIL